jgi:hypothetical protein
MAETCGICKREYEKGEDQENRNLKLTLTHVPAEGAGTEGAAPAAEKNTLEVPRCSDCLKKATIWAWRSACILALVGAVIGDLLLRLDKNSSGIKAYGLLLLGTLVGAVIGYLVGKALRHTYENRQALTFPAVKSLLDSGWIIEKTL